ncbi:MAG: chitobiase/beta-hexosaminidase C-terminal domain-containing protein, partial [Verrucomicrobia bacterium]|nr:chitobiase/beta-hexosaminidase C-terminal domain-containing protein [Verrucomicrobiota bacterium]
TVLNAQILNAYASQHRDAFNLVDSSDVIVSNCVIQGSDDAMVLKSDYALGRKIGGHNIHIIDCQILSTENNATQFGSETVGDFTDVTFSDIGIGGAGKAGIGITSQDGAVIDGVTYDNVTMTNCACPIFLKLDLRTTGSPNPSVGRIRNISVNNVAAWHSTLFNRTNTSTINGYFDGANTIIPIENVVLNNVNVSNIGNNPASAVTNYPVENQNWQPQAFGRWPCYGWYLRWANDISFTNCQAHFDNEDDRPAIVADTVTNLLLDQFTADVGANNTNYDIGLLRVTACEATNVFASALAPVPGAPLRVFNSNSVSALIASPPFFYPGGGTYTATQSVVIASGTPGAMIHYTTDGSTPAITNGILYSGPVSIGGETVLRAMASAAGLTNSAVNTAIYHFPGTDIFIPPPPPPAPVTNFFYEAETLPYATNGAPAGLQSDSNTSGGHWLALEATGTNEWIEFTTPILPAGVYDLQMSYKSHPDRGILAFTFDGVTWPYDLDQYASSPAYPSQDWGEVTFTNASAHTIRLTVVGENPAATGYWLSVDRFLFYLV